MSHKSGKQVRRLRKKATSKVTAEAQRIRFAVLERQNVEPAGRRRRTSWRRWPHRPRPAAMPGRTAARVAVLSDPIIGRSASTSLANRRSSITDTSTSRRCRRAPRERLIDAFQEWRGAKPAQEADLPPVEGLRGRPSPPAEVGQGDPAAGRDVRVPRSPGQEARIPPALHHPAQRRGRDARPPVQPVHPRPAAGPDRPGSQEPLGAGDPRSRGVRRDRRPGPRAPRQARRRGPRPPEGQDGTERSRRPS